jgi:hypothetical protein
MSQGFWIRNMVLKNRRSLAGAGLLYYLDERGCALLAGLKDGSG